MTLVLPPIRAAGTALFAAMALGLATGFLLCGCNSERGARLAEPDARRPYYLAAQEIFRRDLPYVGLFTKFNFAVMPTQLKGYQNYPSGEFYSLGRVHWERD